METRVWTWDPDGTNVQGRCKHCGRAFPAIGLIWMDERRMPNRDGDGRFIWTIRVDHKAAAEGKPSILIEDARWERNWTIIPEGWYCCECRPRQFGRINGERSMGWEFASPDGPMEQMSRMLAPLGMSKGSPRNVKHRTRKMKPMTPLAI